MSIRAYPFVDQSSRLESSVSTTGDAYRAAYGHLRTMGITDTHHVPSQYSYTSSGLDGGAVQSGTANAMGSFYEVPYHTPSYRSNDNFVGGAARTPTSSSQPDSKAAGGAMAIGAAASVHAQPRGNMIGQASAQQSAQLISSSAPEVPAIGSKRRVSATPSTSSAVAVAPPSPLPSTERLDQASYRSNNNNNNNNRDAAWDDHALVDTTAFTNHTYHRRTPPPEEAVSQSQFSRRPSTRESSVRSDRSSIVEGVVPSEAPLVTLHTAVVNNQKVESSAAATPRDASLVAGALSATTTTTISRPPSRQQQEHHHHHDPSPSPRAADTHNSFASTFEKKTTAADTPQHANPLVVAAAATPLTFPVERAVAIHTVASPQRLPATPQRSGVYDPRGGSPTPLNKIDRLRDEKRADALSKALHDATTRLSQLNHTLVELVSAHQELLEQEATLRTSCMQAESERDAAAQQCADIQRAVQGSMEVLQEQLASRRDRLRQLREDNQRMRAALSGAHTADASM